MWRTFVISALVGLVAGGAGAIEPCSLEAGCPGERACGIVEYSGYFALYADFSEVSYMRSYCSLTDETIAESYTVSCCAGVTTCQAKSDMEAQGIPFDLEYYDCW